LSLVKDGVCDLLEIEEGRLRGGHDRVQQIRVVLDNVCQALEVLLEDRLPAFVQPARCITEPGLLEGAGLGGSMALRRTNRLVARVDHGDKVGEAPMFGAGDADCVGASIVGPGEPLDEAAGNRPARRT
jgi:hypothetical protein